eukprot:CAMPEP_0195046020 /NCGR_PEP_ID=MMETSP0347-20130606/20558_1 /TAXON_ID=2932 /ORGANISM="Alexandrium fundyense, Strain CCMP1719" /LENGTH=49 /DNA_ID= /DNA_START= /DNA_END= /DNA_ORIENTATION=
MAESVQSIREKLLRQLLLASASVPAGNRIQLCAEEHHASTNKTCPSGTD